MNTKKSPFQWVDRDTAGYDLLQVVYHAPYSVSLTALELLSSIRSTAIINDLQVIALNEEWDDWSRVYAIRAIASTRSDQEFSNLKPLVTRQLQMISHHWQADHNPNKTGFLRHSNILREMFNLVDKCPANYDWFFEIIDNFENQEITLHLMSNLYNFAWSERMFDTIEERFFTLLQNQTNILNLDLIPHLMIDDRKIRTRLNPYLDIIAASIGKDDLKQHIGAIEYWEELYEILKERYPEIDQLVKEHDQKIAEWRLRRQRPELDTIPIYQQVKQLYDDARSGNKTAYQNLIRVVRLYRGEIPIRAVAVYFLGKLQGQYDSMHIFKQFITHTDDIWIFRDAHYAPIRFEIGAFLCSVPSAQTWQYLVEGYFRDIPNELTYFIDGGITYVTDVLSGVESTSSQFSWGDIAHRPWFTALANYDDKIIDDYIGG